MDNKIILSVGQFIYRKGFDVLIKAMSQCPKNYELYIIGDEPTDEMLTLCKAERLRNVHFEGFKTKRELERYYLAADLFVLPTREDIWGLVINEAMARGLPVITTDRCIAGLELIDDGMNGYIVLADDARGLAEKIQAILSDDEISSQMAISSIEKINGYNYKAMAESHIRVLQGANE